MLLVSVRTPLFARALPAANAREALQTLWMFAGQDFEVVVLDDRGRVMTIQQLEEIVATTSCAFEAKEGNASNRDVLQ